MKSRLLTGHIPIFTSDHLRHYFSALCSHFGDYRREPGRRNWVWRVSVKLLYAMLIKVRSGRRLRYTITLPIFGTRGQIRDALFALGLSGKIQTSYVDRGASSPDLGLAVEHNYAELPTGLASVFLQFLPPAHELGQHRSQRADLQALHACHQSRVD